MAFLKSHRDMGRVDWARSYLWDMKFIGGTLNGRSFEAPPYPFDQWFPASDFEELTYTGASLSAEYFISMYKVPQRTFTSEITITFYDNVDQVLSKWINSWYASIYDKSNGVACLYDSVRLVQIAKLKLDRTLLETKTLYVYPDGPATSSGNSQSDTKTKTIQFVIAGSV